MNNEFQEKKLRGSGGYTIAKISDEEQKLGNLGGPELFLAGIGRLEDNRFSKYFCNRCEKEYEGSPSVVFENPNEDLGEGVLLVEKGEYKCKQCDNTIAQYRKFDQIKNNEEDAGESIDNKENRSNTTHADASMEGKTIESETINEKSPLTQNENFTSIDSLKGVYAYDNDAMLVGKVEEIGLLKSQIKGKKEIGFKLSRENKSDSIIVSWNEISKIGDIILLKSEQQFSQKKIDCKSCGHENDFDSIFCESCGSQLK